MTAFIIALLAGLLMLALGSDRFVDGAAGIARGLGVTPMVVGLTIVALGTSAPEMLVSAMAAAEGNPGLAVGNVLGSNIANITLVVGAAALIVPLVVGSATLRREFPLLFGVTALAWLLCSDGTLTQLDSIILIAATVALLWFIVLTARAAAPTDPLRRELDASLEEPVSVRRSVLWCVIGLTVLLVGSRLVVFGAVGLAKAFGVSDLVVGLTVVAVGTSLPELAAVVASALRGEPDMAVGNVLGSNMFNLLPVLAMAGIFRPFDLDSAALVRDFPVVAGLTVVLLLMCMGRRGPGRVTRFEGSILLAGFVGYQVMLYVTLS